ncbi:hypothetical protein FQN54_009794 [Arachnomyces sp. PD_36]|nr:hypothetical protein FQN54_009794 [Arachnomyces sp. PD_36]
MTYPSPRKSVDSLNSVASVPSLSQRTPNYESPRIPSRRYAPRRGSTASSVLSLGGPLDPSQSRGSIAESGQNAISTLLQPPIVRTGLLPQTAVSSSGYKPPSSRDIPPVTLTNIPHVDSTAFQPYLAQVGSLYDAFQSAKDNNEESDSRLVRRNTDEETAQIKPLERSHSGSSTLQVTPQPSSQQRKSSTGRSRGHGAAPLSTIPNIYFDENFRLENPRTFDIVSERSDVVKPTPKPGSGDAETNGTELAPTGRKALATNAILQEKLSWYMDTVEIHLISSISTASTSFFTALGSLRELHSEAADSVNKIQALRKDLTKLDREMALGGLKVVNLRRRRENVRKLAAAIAQLESVVASVSECEDMVESGEIEKAMDGLDDIERLMAGEQTRTGLGEKASIKQPGQSIDLRRLKALEGASEDLGQLRYRIGMGYENRFLDGLLGDLRRHVEAAPHDATLQRWGTAFHRTRGGHRSSPSSFPAYMNLDDQFRERLRTELTGLGRARHTMPAATAFKTSVLREMKSLIRRHLPSSSDDDNESMMSASTIGGRHLSQQEKSSILARNLRALDPDDAQEMLTKVYTGVSECLRRLSVQVKVLLDITSGLGNPRSPLRSPTTPNPENGAAPGGSRPGPGSAVIAQEEILQVLDMSSLLGQAVDIVQSQMTKVLKVRAEQTAHLSLEEFLRYFALNRLFADECEAISGRSGTSLKTIVDNQIREFITQFGESQKQQVIQAMDADRWDARDFGDDENVILSRILEGSTKDVDFWSTTSQIWVSSEKDTEGGGTTNGTAVNGNSQPPASKDKVRFATIDEQKYILPTSATLILKSMESFQHLMTGIPSMVQEIASTLLDCLKVFNSRASQLILGAGATRCAGLKNITTKHLALASQSLSFTVALIPYVREFVRRHCSSGSLMAEFDKVKRLYQEHQTGIHEKLIEIMGSRAGIHVNSMKKIDWDKPVESSAVSPYMETLAKETATLQRVLAKHLPEGTVMMIMKPVFDSYKDQWTRAFREAELNTEPGKQRMLSDVEFFNTKISKIDGSGDLGEQLLAVVKEKQVAQEAIKSPSPSSGSSGSTPKPQSPLNGTNDA